MSGESGLGAIFAHDGAVGLGVVDPVIILHEEAHRAGKFVLVSSFHLFS